MTVGELRSRLESLPEDLEVRFAGERGSYSPNTIERLKPSVVGNEDCPEYVFVTYIHRYRGRLAHAQSDAE